MESNYVRKETDIKNHTFYYFDDVIKIKILILIKFYKIKNYTEIF